jgi:hypothetical protein
MGFGCRKQRVEPLEKVIVVGIVPEDSSAFYALDDYVLKDPRSVQAGSSRHGLHGMSNRVRC